MKSIIQIFVCLLCFSKLSAQDYNLFQTWYLYQLEVNVGGVIWDIETEQAEILPYLTINSDLTFDGIGACNGFSGYYTYNNIQNSLYPNNVYFTLGGCDTSEEIIFENTYFPYVDADTDHTITLIDNGDFMELRLESFPGFIHSYRNVSLSISDNLKPKFNLYPNPAKDKLYIDLEDQSITTIVVYDIKGNRSEMTLNSEGSIDISKFENGLYFIEIESSIGKDIKKFIKL